MSVDIFHIKLGLNSCYLIRGKNIVMIDGGMPNKLRTFRMQLSRFNIQPEEVKLIVLTHSHFDNTKRCKHLG